MYDSSKLYHTDDDDDDIYDEFWEENDEVWLSRECFSSYTKKLCLINTMFICIFSSIMIIGSVHYLFRTNYRTAQMIRDDSIQFLNETKHLCDHAGSEARYGNRGYIACNIARSDMDKSIIWIATIITSKEIAFYMMPKANYINVAILVILMICLFLIGALSIFIWLVCSVSKRGSAAAAMTTYYVNQAMPSVNKTRTDQQSVSSFGHGIEKKNV